MLLTIVCWTLSVFAYVAWGAVIHSGLEKIVNTDRWDHVKGQKHQYLPPLSVDWHRGNYKGVILFLAFWPIWIFGGFFVVGIIGNDD